MIVKNRIFIFLIRSHRRLFGRCLACGNKSISQGKWFPFDSDECAMYNRCASVRADAVLEKPSLTKGYTMFPKYVKENYN
jgi:hypothetical protein